jgi:hypothetical protein
LIREYARLYESIGGSEACGNMCTNLMSTGGVVQSGNFPGDYGKDARNCGVTITTPAGWMIQLKFTTFNLEFKKAFVYVRKRNQISALDDSVILILFELSGVR